jgi:hypothetical protein
MKKIEIDCNFNYLGPNKPCLSHEEIKRYELKINEQIIAIQDEDEWIGKVLFDDSLPYSYQW